MGIALAITSSLRDVAIPTGLVALGEIGLTGEIRTVPQISHRVEEAQRLGLSKCLVPQVSAHATSGRGSSLGHAVDTLSEALSYALPRSGNYVESKK